MQAQAPRRVVASATVSDLRRDSRRCKASGAVPVDQADGRADGAHAVPTHGQGDSSALVVVGHKRTKYRLRVGRRDPQRETRCSGK